jgi:hypothetical protein
MAEHPENAATIRTPVRYPEGLHLRCANCGAEVKIISSCPCDPPDMILQCCGQDMKPEATGSGEEAP